MKTTKMSLANIQGKLSRSEMKKIMAGSGVTCGMKDCIKIIDGKPKSAICTGTTTCTCPLDNSTNSCY